MHSNKIYSKENKTVLASHANRQQQQIPSNELKAAQQRGCVWIIVYDTTIIYSSSLGRAVSAHVSAERLTTQQIRRVWGPNRNPASATGMSCTTAASCPLDC